MIESHIVVWEKNGIEYLYPKNIIMEIFGCAEARVSELSIVSDTISLNGVERTKTRLSQEVIKKMSPTITLPDEVKNKLILPLRFAIE